jgi:hypothetical protein
MFATGWNSLEVVKLIVAALVPIVVFALGWPITRAARRLDQAQWATRKLIELRLELYADMASSLNDLLCFFRLVGDYQTVTPPVALERKRTLDKAFYVNQHLMSEDFAQCYHDFIAACFLTYTGPGRPAQLRASRRRQEHERENWDSSWNELLIPDNSPATTLSELNKRYYALMDIFGEEIGARRPTTGIFSNKGRRQDPCAS